jgi:predicted lipoprotein with Yx(FWY)xxD motif
MVIAALSVCALSVAACGAGSAEKANSGSTGGGAYSQQASTPTPSSAAGDVTVKVSTTKLGRILTDDKGRTLYLFEKDKPATSRCSGACASIWPPLAGGTAMAGAGVSSAQLGSIKRADGKTETTYAGHPLYTYAGDAKPGDTRGQGLDQFGAEWYVLAPNGRKVDND